MMKALGVHTSMQQVLLLWEGWEPQSQLSTIQSQKNKKKKKTQPANCRLAAHFTVLVKSVSCTSSFVWPFLSVPNAQDSDLLVITILDENDNRPVFTRTSYTAEIKENSAAGIPLCCACLHSSLECVHGGLQLYHRALCLGTVTLSPPLPDFVYVQLLYSLWMFGLGLKVRCYIFLIWCRNQPTWIPPDVIKTTKPRIFHAHLFCPIGNTVTVLNGPVLAVDNDTGTNAVVKYKLLGARMDIFTVDANTGKT